MSDAYLLDTNVILDVILPESKRRCKPFVLSRLSALKSTENRVLLPVMAIAEIEFGLAVQNVVERKEVTEVRKFFADYPLHMPFDDRAVEAYSLIRAEIFRSYGTAKPSGRGSKEKTPEELRDRVTGKELGIDERDLIIASIAVNHNFKLVTNDRQGGMSRIEKAAAELQVRQKLPVLRVEHWDS